jgi:hypothetical protein
MTVSSLTTSVTYVGNGVTTAFPVTFPFFEITVEETIAGVTTALVEGSDYSVSGGAGSTGTVTISPAPASGTTIVIRRTTDRRQLADYVENDPFPAQTHEQALDRLTMVVQELANQLDSDGDGDADEALSAPEWGGPYDAKSRKIENLADGTDSADAINKAQLDAAILDANGIVNSDNITQGSTQLFMTAAERAAAAGLVDSPRSGISSTFTHFARSVPLNVREFGVYGNDNDGSLTDESTGMLAAFTQAIAEGRELFIPGTNYLGRLTVPGAYKLRVVGDHANRPILHCPQSVADAGTTLLNLSNGATSVSLELAADVRPGQNTLTVTSTADVLPGMLVRIMSNRLWAYDHRDQWYCGEMHLVSRVYDATTIEIHGATWDAYDVSVDTITMDAFLPNRLSMSHLHFKMPAPATEISTTIIVPGRLYMPVFEGLKFEGATSSGLQLRNSWSARGYNVEFENIGRSSSLGYGWHDICSVGTTIDGITGRGCRRTFDGSSTTGAGNSMPTRRVRVKNIDVSGGGAQSYGGASFYPTGEVPSFGVGGHGPMEDAVFGPGRIASVREGVMVRGRKTTVEGIIFTGKMETCVYATFGTDLTVRDCEVDYVDWPRKTQGTGVTDSYENQPNYFVQFGSGNSTGGWNYDSPVVIQNNTVTGLRSGFVNFRELSDAKNIVCRHNTVMARPAPDGTFNFFDAAGAVNLSHSITGPNYLRRLTGSGTIAMYNSSIVVGYRADRDAPVQIGHARWRVVMPDNTAVRIQHAVVPGDRAKVSIVCTEATARGDFTMVAGSATLTTAGVIGTNLEGSASVLDGTTGNDGKFTVHLNSDGSLYLENRLDAQVTVTVSIL